MPITYYEVDGYPQESRSRKQFSATRKVVCNWNDRTALREEFIRWPGQLYPYASSFGARVTGVTIEPFGGNHQDALGADLNWYEGALLTVTYETPETGDARAYPEQKDPQKHEDQGSAISESLEPYLETHRMDHTAFRWKDVDSVSHYPLNKEEAPVYLQYRETYTLTRHNMLAVPDSILSLTGTTNDAQVTPILLGWDATTGTDSLHFAKNTLLFTPPSVAVSMNDSGYPVWDVTMKMLYRPETWYKYWVTRLGKWAELYHKDEFGGLDTRYEDPSEADFSIIFP